MPRQHLHHQAAGVPAAGDQLAKRPGLRRFLVDVHRLRVVAAREIEDVLFTDLDRPADKNGADRIILEIAAGLGAAYGGSVIHRDHSSRGYSASLGSTKSMIWTSSLAVSSTAQL